MEQNVQLGEDNKMNQNSYGVLGVNNLKNKIQQYIINVQFLMLEGVNDYLCYLFLIIGGGVQLLTYQNYQQRIEVPESINFTSFWNIILLICRPSLLYFRSNNKNDNEYQYYDFIFITIILLLFLLLIIQIFISFAGFNNQNSSSNNPHHNQGQKSSKTFLRYLLVCSQSGLNLLITDILVYVFLNSDTLMIKIVTILLFIINLTIALITINYFSTTLSFKHTSQQRQNLHNNSKSLQAQTFLLKIVLISLNHIASTQDLICNSIVLLILSMEIYHSLIENIFLDLVKNELLLIVQVVSFSFSLLELMYLHLNYLDLHQFSISFLTLLPLIIKLVQSYYQSYIKNLLFNEDKKTTHLLTTKIHLLASNYSYLLKNYTIELISKLQIHQKMCRNISCFCQIQYRLSWAGRIQDQYITQKQEFNTQNSTKKPSQRDQYAKPQSQQEITSPFTAQNQASDNQNKLKQLLDHEIDDPKSLKDQALFFTNAQHVELKFTVTKEIYNQYILYLIDKDFNNQKNARSDSSQGTLTYEYDDIIQRYISFYHEQNLNTVAFQRIIDFLYNSSNISRQLRLRLHLLMDQTRFRQMNIYKQSIIKSSDVQYLMDTQKFIDMENLYTQNVASLKELIHQKIDIFYLFKNNIDDCNSLRSINHRLVGTISVNEAKLQNLQKNYPMKRNLNLQSIFFSLVINDWEQALLLQKQSKNDSNNSLRPILTNSIQIYHSDTQYLITTLGKNYGKIVRSSNKIHELLGYTKKEFGFIENINSLIPQTFSGKTHDLIIKQFMLTGKEIISNKMRHLWVINKLNFIVKIMTYMTLDVTYPDDLAQDLNEIKFWTPPNNPNLILIFHLKNFLPPLRYILFILPYSGDEGTIFMNENFMIDGMSQNVLKKFKMGHIKKLPQKFQIDARILLPDLETLIENMKSEGRVKKDFYNHRIFFPNRKHPLSIQYLYMESTNDEENLLYLVSPLPKNYLTIQPALQQQSIKSMSQQSRSTQIVNQFRADFQINIRRNLSYD